jgi:WD40 repeat protein/class 3 adenylate cyclase/tRNA A-37 threonylcarbamoyl transferase component Bud32
VQVSDDPRVGTELAGYRIESLLGWGGMSVVYLAEDLRLKRRVALKLLAAGLAEDESFRDRFLRESELAASIDHPNIVPIYEAGATEDLLFIAMRYVEGLDLNERLHNGPLHPADAINLLAQVASALDAAHARGLVHRDVKPSNVLLDTGARPDGSDHVYLTDFGLTKRVSGETGVGDDGHLLGTIDYVAPEQIAGDEVDGRADVYSLGCVLYECLVGQPPFRRDSEIAVVFAHLEAAPTAPSAERPELPAALDAVIARALEKEPEQRYPSCRELARAALAVVVDETSRLLVDVASRAAAGRSDLSEVEAELTGKVIDFQLVREQARVLAEDTKVELPTGTATFLFTDIEGSTRLVGELGERYAGVLAAHQHLLREAFAASGGREIDSQGDAFFVVFERAKDALGAALAAQRALAAHTWPDGAQVRVRMGMHTSEPSVAGERYIGLGVHKGARICAAAHGGQILLSQASYAVLVDDALSDVTFRDVGEQRLKDFDRPERIYQVVVRDLPAEFAPLRRADAVQTTVLALAGRDPQLVVSEGICPFKGLASFEPSDADNFFGRERLVGELVARVAGAGFLGIVGPSGSGKSSVLRAGLLPALAGGVLPGSGGWRRWLLRPGERPLDALGTVFVSGAKDPLAEALDALPAGTRVLLAVDQLEELFTACRSETERAAFADSLARAAADPDGRAVVVAALRADFYGRFAAYPGLAELLGANNVLVGPMNATELRRAVELPAGRVGLRVEPELVDALVDDVEGEPGALPLLSTALLELWQKRQGDTLTLAAYRESGGVHGAVARLAEGAYARIPDGRKPLMRAVMLRLVGEGEGDTPVRRRAPLAEFDLERNEDVADVLARLADSRLVTVGEGTVEVAHEALLREWPRLREWIEEDAEGRRLRVHVTRAATEWDAAGRDQSELYRGARLAAALDWTADHALDLNKLEREFVAESREASEKETTRVRRTNRRLRGLLAVIAILLAAAAAGGIFALVQRGEARDAETAQLAQRLGAQALVEEDLDLSLLLARQAVAIDDSPQTRGYLLTNLLRVPAVIGIMHGQSDVVRGIAVSPDGRTLAVADAEVGLLLFDTRTFERIGEPVEAPDPSEPVEPGTSQVEAVAYSPDGERLAFGGGGGISVIDARTREPLAEEPFITAEVTGMAFTRDGSRLVVLASREDVVSGDLTWITMRDPSTLKLIGDPIRPDSFFSEEIASGLVGPSFALTADGRSLLTASAEGELAWWDLDRRQKRKPFEIAGGFHAFALSPDGLRVAIGLEDGIQLIDVRTGAVRAARGALASTPYSLLFSPDGETVVSTSRDGAVILWDADALAPRETLRGHAGSVRMPAFSPDGETLYTSSDDGNVIAWDLAGNRRLKRPFTFAHNRGGQSLDRRPGTFSPDGRLIAVGLNGGGIGLWDANSLTRSGAPLLETGAGEVTALAFSPDGRMLAAVTAPRLGYVGHATLWDVESRSLRWGPFYLGGIGIGVSFSADGTMLATASWRGVMLWDVATGDALGYVGKLKPAPLGGSDENPADAVAFSPTAPLLAVARGPRAEVWDAERRALITTLETEAGEQEGDFTAVAFSPDGRHLTTAAGQHVHLWDVRTGKLVREIEQSVGLELSTLEFSPDGEILAGAGTEPFVPLWDVDSGDPIGTRLAAGSGQAMLDFASDGRRLLMTLGNGKGVVWNIVGAQRACALANRTLTREEWETFLPGRPYEPACAG